MIRYPISSRRNPTYHISHLCVSHKQKLPIQFEKGERIQGTVLRAYPGGQVIVSAKGKIFGAHSLTRLARGRVYQFVVTRTRPNVELRVMSQLENRVDSILGLWAETAGNRKRLAKIASEILQKVNCPHGLSPKITPHLKQLAGLLENMVYDEAVGKDFMWMADTLRSSGLFFEKKLRLLAMTKAKGGERKIIENDLKGLVLKLLRGLDHHGGEEKEVSGLRHKLEDILRMIEAHQQINLRSIRNDIGWFWFIPIRDNDDCGGADVLTKRHSSGSFTIWLRIELSAIGPMQVVLNIAGTRVRVSLFLKNRQIARFTSQKAHLLADGMKAQGLSVDSLDVGISTSYEFEMNLSGGQPAEGLNLEV